MHALSIRGLTKTYKNGVQALKGVDLDVEQGDFFALLGPNGAGKTTLIGILTSLVNKSAGSVSVFGHDLDRELEAAKACIGIVPQEINFNQFETPQTILVNQAGFYGIERPLARERTEKYLSLLQLGEKRNKIARGLSGGMKRRLMIARALVHEPRLLILDEPTAGVDIEIRRSMWDFLREINARGTTIILTTHYLEEAETLCRNIAIINGGLIAERDRMSTLLRKLQAETFVLNLREAVSEVPRVPGYEFELIDEHTLEVEVSKEQSLNEVFANLTAQGIGVLSMRNKVNRLEELFMKLVERKPQPEARPSMNDATAPAAAADSTKGLRTARWTGFKTIVIREYGRIVRIWAQTIVPSAVTSALYFVIFGSLIGQRVGLMDGVPYMQYIAPGLIMMAVITNSYGNVVSSFFGAKFGKHVEEMLVAPLPNWIIVLGYVGGGLVRGFLVGAAVTIVSLIFTKLAVHHAFVIFAAVVLTSIVFSLGGFLNAMFAKNFDQVNWIPTFVLTPLTYFGGVFYSISLLPEWAQAISHANPILHMVNAFRYGFLGTSDVNVFVAFGIMLASAVVLFAVALYFMNRGTGMRE